MPYRWNAVHLCLIAGMPFICATTVPTYKAIGLHLTYLSGSVLLSISIEKLLKRRALKKIDATLPYTGTAYASMTVVQHQSFVLAVLFPRLLHI